MSDDWEARSEKSLQIVTLDTAVESKSLALGMEASHCMLQVALTFRLPPQSSPPRGTRASARRLRIKYMETKIHLGASDGARTSQVLMKLRTR